MTMGSVDQARFSGVYEEDEILYDDFFLSPAKKKNYMP